MTLLTNNYTTHSNKINIHTNLEWMWVLRSALQLTVISVLGEETKTFATGRSIPQLSVYMAVFQSAQEKPITNKGGIICYSRISNRDFTGPTNMCLTQL